MGHTCQSTKVKKNCHEYFRREGVLYIKGAQKFVVCACLQSEFIWRLPPLWGPTLGGGVQFLGIVIEHKQYYNEKCTPYS